MEKLLPEVCQIQYGYAFDSKLFSDSEGTPLIRIRDVLRGYSETFTTELCPEQYIVNDGDILIGMDGEFNIAKWHGGKAYLNQRVCKLIPGSLIDRDYLFYFMPGALKHIEEKTPFVTVKHLSAKELNKIIVPMPSIGKQKEIGAALNNLVELIECRKRQVYKLDQLVKSQFIEMFGDFMREQNRWPIFNVGDVADTIDPHPSHRTPPVCDDGVPYIGIADCDYKTNTVKFENARTVGISVLEDHKKRYNIADGDFIIGKIGTIGKPIFIPSKQDYTLSANTVLIQPQKDKVNPVFLIEFFKSAYMDDIIDREKKSTSQPAFGIQKVRKIQMPIPPMDLQNKFAVVIQQADKSKFAIQKSLEQLETLKKSLMQEYFG